MASWVCDEVGGGELGGGEMYRTPDVLVPARPDGIIDPLDSADVIREVY